MQKRVEYTRMVPNRQSALTLPARPDEARNTVVFFSYRTTRIVPVRTVSSTTSR